MKKKYLKELSEEEINILKDKGTEPPFSGEYNDFFLAGVFVCRACKAPLYESNTKFNSNCGWPSFDDEIDGAIVRYEDRTLGRVRTEICCANCDGHLGHVFHGEQITKKNVRHCVNSLSIKFKEYDKLEKATFGGGCFWNFDYIFRNQKGVYISQTGYMGGNIPNPSYQVVCGGDTGHVEVVQLYFDPDILTFKQLLFIFWNNHNPTTLNQQGDDIGDQYQSVIFYHNEKQKLYAENSLKDQQKNWEKTIVTKIEFAKEFFRAEEYHQNYFNKNGIKNCKL